MRLEKMFLIPLLLLLNLATCWAAVTDTLSIKHPDEFSFQVFSVVIVNSVFIVLYVYKKKRTISFVPSDEDFEKDLISLINRYSKENESDTPDYIIAGYLVESLRTFNKTTNKRRWWYGEKVIRHGRNR